MKRVFQLSNIPAYIYILIGAWMSSSLFHLFLDDFEALLAFVIYYIVVLFILDERIIMYLYKIRYNIAPNDLKRIQPLFTKAVRMAIDQGYQLPTSYRIAYINDLSVKDMVCFGKNKIAVSRYVLDHFSDDEITALLMHELARLNYGLPFLEHYLMMCNIFVVITSSLYFIVTGLLSHVLKGLNKMVGVSVSIFFLGTGVFTFYLIQFLKTIALRSNMKKCDQFVCKFGLKNELLNAVNHFYQDTFDDYYKKRYLYISSL